MVARFDMTVNIPTITAIAGLGGIVWWAARRGFQLLELLLKTILWACRQQNLEVPDWLAAQYKQVNGNAYASREEKRDILGPKHDSSDKHKAAGAGENK